VQINLCVCPRHKYSFDPRECLDPDVVQAVVSDLHLLAPDLEHYRVEWLPLVL
jgi:hypothetical protein